MDRQKLQASLQILKAHQSVRVAFVLDKSGALVAWAGKCAGFSPVGQFPSVQSEEEPVNLYLTTLGPYYLGVLFTDGDEIDVVRELVEGENGTLVSSLGIEGSAS